MQGACAGAAATRERRQRPAVARIVLEQIGDAARPGVPRLRQVHTTGANAADLVEQHVQEVALGRHSTIEAAASDHVEHELAEER